MLTLSNTGTSSAAPAEDVLLDAADLGEVLDVAPQRADAAGLPLAHVEVAAVGPSAIAEHELQHERVALVRAVEEAGHEVHALDDHALRLVDGALHDGVDAHRDGLGLLDEARR